MPHGFTVVEALVVMAVLAILIAAAGPMLGGMIVTQQLKNAGFDLASSLAVARSEAVTRNESVTMTPAEGGWARGWTVTGEGGGVIRRQSAYGRISMDGPVRVVFSGDGRPDSIATPFALTSPEAGVATHRCVRIRLNGRPYTTKGAC